MSKIKAPLFSLSAQRSLGKKVFFCSSKRRNIAKKHFSPSNPNTLKQQAHRSYWSMLSVGWREIPYPPFDIKAWEYMASIINRASNGRNMFFREYLKWDHIRFVRGFTDVKFNVFPIPGDIVCQCPPGLSPVLTIVKGPNTGFSVVGILFPVGYYSFVAPFVDTDNVFQITLDEPNAQGWSGYYSFQSSWWI